ncbi:MAG: ROK family protein [Corynebacterium sp.]|nr:ROK family protein [Corynebacterium sp.]
MLTPLIQEHVVESQVHPTGGRGRPTEQISLTKDSAVGIGIDISRFGSHAVVVDAADNAIFTLHLCSRGEWQRDFVAVLGRLQKELPEKVDTSYVRDIGIGVPHAFGSLYVPNENKALLRWVRKTVAEYFPTSGKPFIENTVRIAALAENHWGKAKGKRNIFYLRIAEGIMATATINGFFVLGASGHAGEVGHMPITGAAGKCRCGKTGCFETIATTSALLSSVGVKTVQQLREAYTAHEPAAIAHVAKAADATARICAQAIYFLNPQQIILSGAIPEELPFFIPLVATRLQELLLSGINEEIDLSTGSVSADECARAAILASRQWRYYKQRSPHHD